MELTKQARRVVRIRAYHSALSKFGLYQFRAFALFEVRRAKDGLLHQTRCSDVPGAYGWANGERIEAMGVGDCWMARPVSFMMAFNNRIHGRGTT